MIDAQFIYLALLFNALGMLGYVVNTLRGRTSPNRVTWMLWAVAPLISFFAQLSDGVGLRAFPTLVVGLGPLLVVAASFVNRKAYWRLGPLDWTCGILSATAIVVWSLTGEPVLAIVLSIVADGLAAIPTLAKAYRHPETENTFTYVFGFASAGITLATIDDWTFTFFGFPAYLALLTISLALLSGRRSSRTSRGATTVESSYAS